MEKIIYIVSLEVVLQFINSELDYVSYLIMFGDITLKVVTFISNRFLEFILERNPSRHVNVYRTRFILQLHHQVEVFAVVPLDDVARE